MYGKFSFSKYFIYYDYGWCIDTSYYWLKSYPGLAYNFWVAIRIYFVKFAFVVAQYFLRYPIASYS